MVAEGAGRLQDWSHQGGFQLPFWNRLLAISYSAKKALAHCQRVPFTCQIILPLATCRKDDIYIYIYIYIYIVCNI